MEKKALVASCKNTALVAATTTTSNTTSSTLLPNTALVVGNSYNNLPLPIAFNTSNNRFYETSNNTTSMNTYGKFNRMTDLTNTNNNNSSSSANNNKNSIDSNSDSSSDDKYDYANLFFNANDDKHILKKHSHSHSHSYTANNNNTSSTNTNYNNSSNSMSKHKNFGMLVEEPTIHLPEDFQFQSDSSNTNRSA